MMKIFNWFKEKNNVVMDDMTIREKLLFIIEDGKKENKLKGEISTMDGGFVKIIVDDTSLTIRTRRYYYEVGFGELIIFNIDTPVDEIFKKLFPREYRKEKLQKLKDIIQ